MDNAVDYSKPGSAVRIEGKAQNGHFDLHVTNLVQQLRTEDLPHLFQRFWRKDAARPAANIPGWACRSRARSPPVLATRWPRHWTMGN